MSATLTPPDLRKALDDLNRRLIILERRITPPPTAGKGGGGGPYIVVASSYTSKERQNLADFVCDGTADEAEINAATDAAMNDNGLGATVLLLEGVYYLDAPVTTYGSLIGVSRQWTRIDFRGTGHAIASSENPLLAHLQITVPYTYSGGGIDLFQGGGVVDDVDVIISGNGTESAIRAGSSCTIKGSYIQSYSGFGIDINDQGGVWITDNGIDCATGIVALSASELFITGNLIGSGSQPGNGYLVGDPDWADAVGCGIAILSSGPGTLIGNRVVGGIPSHGILVAASSGMVISDNAISNFGQQATGSYSGIHIRDGSDDNAVQGNRVRSGSHVNSEWGIKVADSTCIGNLITNNDLLDSGDTANFSDAGTGTVTTAGNRT